MTRFLAEQLSTAHWFDQRHTREVLDWVPGIGVDEGLQRLAAYYGSGPVRTAREREPSEDPVPSAHGDGGER
jgi:hypothetical protein